MARAWSVPGYTAVKVLGSGGFGEVVLARHDVSGTQVAIKYLRGELVADPQFAELFRAEAAVLASLDDPNVVRLYEYIESQSGAAIVMELIDGVSLRDILSRHGKTTAEAALVVLQGSLLGLAAAHRRGVVHRDYKPENVLIDRAGASKLTDFGIAARAGDSAIPAGTLAYAPPEQFGGGPATPAGDVYAATATFYECLTGRPPFSGDSAERLLYQHLAEPVPLEPVPEPLRPLVVAGLAKDPGGRPADGAALVAELRGIAGGAYGPGWEDRGRAGLAAAAALLVAALWPSAAPAAAQGRVVHRISLRRRLVHGHSAAAKATAITGTVVVGIAVAGAVILTRPAGHTTQAPPTTPARATAPAPAPAAAPAQLTGTQLAAALLPISDFPAGYQAPNTESDSGRSLTTILPDVVSTANCTLGNGGDLFDQIGAFNGFGTAYATNGSTNDSVGARQGEDLYINQAIYQFADPAQAGAFFASARTCLIDNNTWSTGVNTAPVNGDEAVTTILRSSGSNGGFTVTEPLLVLHGTDVFAIASASAQIPVVTIPGGAGLMAKLIARVEALGPVPAAVSSPATSAEPSPALAQRQQAAQALAALLARSGADRTAVTQAVSAVAGCSPGLSQDETIFTNAASSHQALLGELTALPDRSALPASMLQALTMAWQASGEADQDFARWTQDEITQGCSTNYQSDANYQAARVPDDQATKDKKAFAALWMTVADEYGLPLYQYNQL